MPAEPPLPPNLRADAFVGTAGDYLKYRFPYPAALLADLTRRAGTTGAGRLMDLACGPGRVAFALASSFQEIWAIDLEPEMIEAGRAEAERRGIAHIRWSVGRAEEVEAPTDAFEMIALGEAFHRVDQRRVAVKAVAWLKPGGSLATLGGDGVIDGGAAWQEVVRRIVSEWTGLGTSAPGAPVGLAPGNGPAGHEQVLREAGFVDVGSYSFIAPQVWTPESIVGYLHTTSYASKKALGVRADAFGAELRSALIAHDPSGRYPQDLGFGYTIAIKPGRA